MKKLLILVFTITVTLFSCNDSENMKKIVGEWECSSWIVTSTKADKCNNNVFFMFNADKTYSSKIGQTQDEGTYKIIDGTLFTHPAGKEEIAVKIIELDSASMQFLMNQGGKAEVLSLEKK